MYSPFPNLKATGTIRPYRLVAGDTSNDNSGVEANANGACVGIADGSTKDYTSSNHAESGDVIKLQDGRAGNFRIEVGSGGLTRFGRFKSDADGKAVAIATTGTTNQESPGYVTESASSGDVVDCVWEPKVIRPAVS